FPAHPRSVHHSSLSRSARIGRNGKIGNIHDVVTPRNAARVAIIPSPHFEIPAGTAISLSPPCPNSVRIPTLTAEPRACISYATPPPQHSLTPCVASEYHPACQPSDKGWRTRKWPQQRSSTVVHAGKPHAFPVHWWRRIATVCILVVVAASSLFL